MKNIIVLILVVLFISCSQPTDCSCPNETPPIVEQVKEIDARLIGRWRQLHVIGSFIEFKKNRCVTNVIGVPTEQMYTKDGKFLYCLDDVEVMSYVFYNGSEYDDAIANAINSTVLLTRQYTY
jgi:hypothetical protein